MCIRDSPRSPLPKGPASRSTGGTPRPTPERPSAESSAAPVGPFDPAPACNDGHPVHQATRFPCTGG
eukprot:10066488-Alexandrium_andersonii.AAC.1